MMTMGDEGCEQHAHMVVNEALNAKTILHHRLQELKKERG
jgi:hypothetical protein